MPRRRRERKGGSQARERGSGEEEGGKKWGTAREGDIQLSSVCPPHCPSLPFSLSLCGGSEQEKFISERVRLVCVCVCVYVQEGKQLADTRVTFSPDETLHRRPRGLG
jgi:hypothetical protein